MTIEAIGYVASALVVASLTMRSVVRLRAISLVGSTTFVVYGALIGSIPIVVTNASIAVINVWFLSRELGPGRDLGTVVVPPDSPFLLDFLHHHERDLTRFQPQYDPSAAFDFALVLTRDGLPAGVVLGRRVGRRLDISVDYVLRAYRDSRLGHWLFGPGAGVLRGADIDEVTTLGGDPTHRSYLARVGFEYDPSTSRFTRRV